MDWLQENLPLGSGILDYSLFSLAGTPITVATLIVFIAIIAVTFVAPHLIQKALVKALRMRSVQDEGTLEVARSVWSTAQTCGSSVRCWEMPRGGFPGESRKRNPSFC